MTKLAELLKIASKPLMAGPPDLTELQVDEDVAELAQMLRAKNGFYAFEGALHVFSDRGTEHELGLLAWNARDSWRQDYEDMADEGVFFAEDVFGTQFVLRDHAVETFDPETGKRSPMAESLEGWAQKILEDYDFWTGHPIAHEWQSDNGPIPLGTRLVPVRPFVAGGEFTAANVRAIDAVEGMRFRASIATQIRDLPDGTQIEFEVVD